VASDMQKIGGIAAIIEALAYSVGFAVMLTVLMPDNADALSAAQRLAFTLDKQAIIIAWNLFIYVLFGVVLVVLSLALHQRLAAQAEALTKVATAFGLIWAALVIAAGMIANTGLGAAAKLHAAQAQGVFADGTHGTSFAAPFVSAAVLLALAGGQGSVPPGAGIGTQATHIIRRARQEG